MGPFLTFLGIISKYEFQKKFVLSLLSPEGPLTSCTVFKRTDKWIPRKKVLQMSKPTDKQMHRHTALNSWNSCYLEFRKPTKMDNQPTFTPLVIRNLSFRMHFTAIYSHSHPEIIEITLSYPEFILTCKKSVILSIHFKIQPILESCDQRG